jgi:hypothetical protein
MYDNVGVVMQSHLKPSSAPNWSTLRRFPISRRDVGHQRMTNRLPAEHLALQARTMTEERIQYLGEYPMHDPLGSRLCRWLTLSWSMLTIVYLLAISVLVLRDGAFPLNFGSIHTTGRTGLWLTLLPSLAGCVALLLALRRVRAGAWLLSIYSLLWTGVLVSGLPAVWNARTSFCTRAFCITTPWIGRLLLLALAMPFLLVALWTSREACTAASGQGVHVRG